jgi:hypothetical protein
LEEDARQPQRSEEGGETKVNDGTEETADEIELIARELDQYLAQIELRLEPGTAQGAGVSR